MNSVQIEQKSYEMPPREGISIAHFLTVKDIERSARYYETVFALAIVLGKHCFFRPERYPDLDCRERFSG